MSKCSLSCGIRFQLSENIVWTIISVDLKGIQLLFPKVEKLCAVLCATDRLNGMWEATFIGLACFIEYYVFLSN
jgi:hypothetical protein